VRSWNPTLFAAEANELAQDKKFGSCRLSQATIEAWERSGARDAANKALIIGSFHSQPGANTKPSREDLERWREMLDRAFTRHQMRKQVHLIVTAARDGYWFKPTLTAWSMRQDESRTGERR
jgi:hypothetical protein